MKTFEVIYHKATDVADSCPEKSQWVLVVKVEPVKRVLVLGTRKAEAVAAAKRYCKATATHNDPISLRVKNRNGRYSKEFTYPRSADPVKSKG